MYSLRHQISKDCLDMVGAVKRDEMQPGGERVGDESRAIESEATMEEEEKEEKEEAKKEVNMIVPKKSNWVPKRNQ